VYHGFGALALSMNLRTSFERVRAGGSISY
jgi:hypothetical protein